MYATLRHYVGAFATRGRIDHHDERGVPILFAQRCCHDSIVALDDGVPTCVQLWTAVGSLSA